MTVQPFAAIGTLVGAAVVRTDRRILRDLRSADATSPEHAVDLSGSRLRQMRVRRLASAGVLERTGTGFYFPNEQGWTTFSRRRRIRALGAVILAILATFLAVASFVRIRGALRCRRDR